MKQKLSVTTYQAGLIQAKAYRNLKNFMVEQLKKYDLTMMEWALLGHVYESGKSGVRTGMLAKNFDVEASLMTNMINDMESKKLVVRVPDLKDRRAKSVITTDEGSRIAEAVEKSLRAEMKMWTKSIRRRDMLVYLKVLRQIAAL